MGTVSHEKITLHVKVCIVKNTAVSELGCK